MKKITLTFCTATILLFACNNGGDDDKAKSDSTATGKSDAKKEDVWVPVDSATMMKAMMDYGKIGPMQQMMASWNGTWSGEMTMWDHDGAVPNKFAGTAIYSMALGGRYQVGHHTSSMMGMPFEGMGTTGYDNATKLFTSTWIDNMGSGIMTMTGPWDEATKTMTLTGIMPDICRPGKTCGFKETLKIIDDHTQHMEMFGPDPKTGKEYKMMEIHSTKKK